MKIKLLSTLAILGASIALIVSSQGIASDKSTVPYPEGYRNWTHVKSMLIEPGHPLENPFQGIHHVYGNAEAIQGLADGKYAEGSVLVFDLLGYDQKDT